MRVISGKVRGKILKSLEGEATRPTTDKVKESIFNIIQFEIEDKNVLDLFGGSGQLAIESVSRGAKKATVVDNSAKAVDIIKRNVKECGFLEEISIRRGDFTEVLTKGAKYDVIFLDPPYKCEMIFKALELIKSFDILSNDGIIVCETDINTKIDGFDEVEYSLREYRYGRIKLTIIRKL